MNEVTVVEAPKAKWWLFTQNNSGGHFDRDENVSHFVFIEAHNAIEARARAESVGVYFDGVDKELDCECCGDRWYMPWSDEGEDGLMIYNKPIGAYDDMFCRPGDTYCVVHHLDGLKQIYRREAK